MSDSFSQNKGGGIYLKSVLNTTFKNSFFQNNNVYFNDNLPNNDKNS